MKKNKKLLIGLIVMFVVLLGTTLFISFSSNLDGQEVIVKSITPIYDETSTVVVDNENVVFNDKNQFVDYKVVIENTQNYDVKITDIVLTTPTEEFLQYTVEDISKDDVLKANSTKELTISLETTGIKGWGRNFADELTANISFEKVAKQEEVIPPTEDKEEDKQPEPPTINIEEVISKTEKVEIEKITNNTIELKDGIKLEDGDKAETWIYPETKFYGYNEVDESNVIKEIVLENDKLDELEVKSGEHNVVISTEDKEVLGYVEIYINEKKELLTEKLQDTTDKEENKPSVNKPSEDKKEDEEGKIENPYTSDKGLLVVLVIATGVTGLGIIIVTKNKFAKYTIFILMLSPAFTITNAEEVIEVAIKNNISFESQNVMKPAGSLTRYGFEATDYWIYRYQIENIYIQNEISEIEEYTYKFDVSQQQNGRVIAYLVPTGEQKQIEFGDMDWKLADMYDLYLQADGIIYPNPDASYYFAAMENLDKIDNLNGIDTSNVTNMSSMFDRTGLASSTFTLDVSTLNFGNVTDMSGMFYSTSIKLDVSTLNFGNVTDMSSMFYFTSIKADTTNIELTIKNPNVKVDHMFTYTKIQEGTQIIINYTNNTKGIANRVINSKSEGANIVLGEIVEAIEETDELSIGDEVELNGEYFNVVSQTEDTVTMLAQYNLGTDYLQSHIKNAVYFSKRAGWEYEPGPQEIAIQYWSTNPKTYVNAYVEYLKEILNDDTLTGDLMTLKDLKALGCTVSSDYDWGSGEWDCYDSPYGWIVNEQKWWTRSATPERGSYVWYVGEYGDLSDDNYSGYSGIRPVITISKETLKRLNS